jgi:hypothetical protein
MQIFQVLIPASGKAQFPTLPNWPQNMTVQNNSNDIMRVGDVSVVAGLYGTGKGLLLNPGDSYTFQLGQDRSTRTSEWWVAGTSTDILDVIII